MRIFLAGATGVLGVRLLPLFLDTALAHRDDSIRGMPPRVGREVALRISIAVGKRNPAL
jgi:hypothetical protein